MSSLVSLGKQTHALQGADTNLIIPQQHGCSDHPPWNPLAWVHASHSKCVLGARKELILFKPLSYGFVTFTSESDAAAAVSQLDKSEIAGRQVNVEVAKPMPTPNNNNNAASAPRRAAKKAAQLAATKQTAQDATAGTSEGEGATAAATGAKKARKPVSLSLSSSLESPLRETDNKKLISDSLLLGDNSASPVVPALPAPTTRLKKPATLPSRTMPSATPLMRSPASASRTSSRVRASASRARARTASRPLPRTARSSREPSRASRPRSVRARRRRRPPPPPLRVRASAAALLRPESPRRPWSLSATSTLA